MSGNERDRATRDLTRALLRYARAWAAPGVTDLATTEARCGLCPAIGYRAQNPRLACCAQTALAFLDVLQGPHVAGCAGPDGPSEMPVETTERL